MKKILIPIIALFVIMILAFCLVACYETNDDALPSVPGGNDTTEAGKDNARIKEIDLLSGNNGYVIEAGASQKFVFAPEYSGEYTFDTDHSSSLKVSYGAEASDITGVFSKELSAGERFEFEARYEGNETVTGNVAVDVAEVSDNKAVFNADVNESRILKFAPEESAMYDIKGSAGLLVCDVRRATSMGELVRIDMYGETEYAPANEAQFFLSDDRDYYVIALNARNSESECEVSLALTEAELRNGNGIELVSNGNYKFYKYVYDGIAGYNVKITFDNIENEKDVLRSVVFDASGKRLPSASFSYGEIVLNNVKEGVYYVGIMLVSDETFTFTTTPQIVIEKALYEWKITKDGEEVPVGVANVAELARNATYKFELLFYGNGETVKVFPIEIVGSDLTGLVIDNDTGLVTIGAERAAGDAFTLCGKATDHAFYSYTLTVIPI